MVKEPLMGEVGVHVVQESMAAAKVGSEQIVDAQAQTVEQPVAKELVGKATCGG